MVNGLIEKYGKDINYVNIIMGLSYFEDAENEILPKTFIEYDWENIKKFFMNILLAIAVMIIIIIASYLADRKYPTKRIFIIPCGIILLCFVAVYSSLVIPSSSNSARKLLL